VLEDRAKDIGRLIGQSSEYQAVKRANEALTANPEAVAVLKQMETIRREAQAMIERGEQPTEAMEQQLDELLLKVQGSPVYQAVMVAQENFDKLMQRVNEWILDGIRRGAASPIITLG
jgi:cell fate (sporulation/competence/biofilm development) regulator YlbF (YheA/YmcA/DUF963 family)